MIQKVNPLRTAGLPRRVRADRHSLQPGGPWRWHPGERAAAERLQVRAALRLLEPGAPWRRHAGEGPAAARRRGRVSPPIAAVGGLLALAPCPCNLTITSAAPGVSKARLMAASSPLACASSWQSAWLQQSHQDKFVKGQQHLHCICHKAHLPAREEPDARWRAVIWWSLALQPAAPAALQTVAGAGAAVAAGCVDSNGPDIQSMLRSATDSGSHSSCSGLSYRRWMTGLVCASERPAKASMSSDTVSNPLTTCKPHYQAYAHIKASHSWRAHSHPAGCQTHLPSAPCQLDGCQAPWPWCQASG